MHRSKSKPLLSGWGQTTTSPLGSCVSFHQAADNSAPALRSPPRSTELMDRNARLLCADHLQLLLWREIPEHGSDQQ